MNFAPQTSALSSWEKLREQLSGSFVARASGLLANDFVIEKDGTEFGRLRVDDLRSARFVAEDFKAEVEKTPDNGYRVFSGGGQLLSAESSSAETLDVACAGKVYKARVSFLRNAAVARSPAGDEVSRLEGNFTGRRYTVEMDDEPAALPISILLLYHTATLRKRVYQA